MQIGLVILMIINPCYLFFHIGKWNNELELKKKTSIAMLSLKVKYMMVPQVTRHAMWISSNFANNIDHPHMKPIIIYDENQHCIYTLKN